jgi:hypothetical protein
MTRVWARNMVLRNKASDVRNTDARFRSDTVSQRCAYA